METNNFLLLLLIFMIGCAVPIFIILFSRRTITTKKLYKSSSPEKVAEFYNQTTLKFLKVYGEIIQAFRTKDVTAYLDYTIKSAELSDGQTILDAGCGVGGPSSYFASKIKSKFIGISISSFQIEKAKELLVNKSLIGQVQFFECDYHKMDEHFDKNYFDRILFLESFGHSNNQPQLIEKAYNLLKPGGILYIKDLFKREHPTQIDGQKIDKIIDAINDAYCYNVADLYEVLKTIRKLNFILLFVKTPEVKIEEFEHLTISNDFQELFDIGKIVSWDNYIFPIDFYEIKVMKPPFDINSNKHLYFLNKPELQKE